VCRRIDSCANWQIPIPLAGAPSAVRELSSCCRAAEEQWALDSCRLPPFPASTDRWPFAPLSRFVALWTLRAREPSDSLKPLRSLATLADRRPFALLATRGAFTLLTTPRFFAPVAFAGVMRAPLTDASTDLAAAGAATPATITATSSSGDTNLIPMVRTLPNFGPKPMSAIAHKSNPVGGRTTMCLPKKASYLSELRRQGGAISPQSRAVQDPLRMPRGTGLGDGHHSVGGQA
jgi:hypothetical protein